MLNKTKNHIMKMLETLRESLNYIYLVDDKDANNVIKIMGELIDTINISCKDESIEFTKISTEFKRNLLNYQNDYVKEDLYSYHEKMVECIKKIPRQYKVVFLPYYENTWDSLESVYEAFKYDPQFITEIIIIPIHRNTPTGNILVYDDYLTPLGIPNTHYDKYSFELDMPDIVFYNNPYDGVNISKFRSDEIKKYTNLMVYIPYYLESPRYFTNINFKLITRNVLELPGHDNADIMVGGGDWVVNTIQSYNSKKRISLGNPKTDFFVKAQKKGRKEVPEWGGKNPTGFTFMLNNHYTIAVNNDRFYPHIIEHIFDFIDKNENSSLIWRPHPQTFLMLNERTDGVAEDIRILMNRARASERIILDTSGSTVNGYLHSNAFISTSWSSTVLEALFFNLPTFVGHQDLFTRNDISILNASNNIKKDWIYWNDAVIQPKCSIKNINDWDNVITDFMYDVMNGKDNKKDIRKTFIKEAFKNGNGTCGVNICKYVKGIVEREGYR